MSDAESAKVSLSFQMGIISLGGIFVMFVFGHMVARAVTKPVSNIVAVTQQVANGYFDTKAELPPVVELQQLADAINMMSAKLSGFEKQVALSSRLAAAGKVAAAMSHEIRNPLSSIKMLAQLLRDKQYIAMEDRQLIHSMLEEIMRVERIVGDVSSMARPAEIVRQHHDIQELINEIMVVIAPKLNHRKVQVVFESRDGMPLILIDRDKIKQVIWNLLLNAMESMPQGGKISICVSLQEKLQRLHVDIEDEGGGIAASHAQEIFSPFFTTKPEGLGLGLSTSKEIMAGHGAELILENREDRGVRARMIFPLAG
jgi:signal transduction histidine kinase